MQTKLRLTQLPLLLIFFGMLGCASRPAKSTFKPVESGDGSPKTPVTAPATAPPVVDLAPTPPPTPPPDAAPVEAPEAECDNKKACRKKGKPGRGMAWACTDGQCVAEPKAKKKRRRGG